MEGVRELGCMGAWMLRVYGEGEMDFKSDGEAPPHEIYSPTLKLQVCPYVCFMAFPKYIT